jgi:hypothetical protein
MAGKRQNSGKKGSSTKFDRSHSGLGKVGSDPAADREIGGELDFGIPAGQATAPRPTGGRDKGPEQGTGPMRSGSDTTRTSGVGHAPGSPGAGSVGDLDTDFIGLDGKGGIAARPASGRTQGPDITEGGSAPFASGPPAKGENELPAGTHGVPPEIVIGSTIDRTGGDAATTGMGGGADAATSSESGRNQQRRGHGTR